MHGTGGCWFAEAPQQFTVWYCITVTVKRTVLSIDVVAAVALSMNLSSQMATIAVDPTNPIATSEPAMPPTAGQPAGGKGTAIASTVLGGVSRYLGAAKTCVDCQRQCVALGGKPKNALTCVVPTALISNCLCLVAPLVASG